jgi:hypothetical protein
VAASAPLRTVRRQVVGVVVVPVVSVDSAGAVLAAASASALKITISTRRFLPRASDVPDGSSGWYSP